MSTDKFVEYALLAKQISSLEVRAEVLKGEIKAEMESEGLQEFKNEYGSYYFTTRKKWEYPDEVVEQEKRLKDMKKSAEERGEAVCEESRSLGFRMAKEEV